MILIYIYTVSRKLCVLHFHLGTLDCVQCMAQVRVNVFSQVVERHGGKMVEEYDSETVTHLLAQNKGSQFFSKVGGAILIGWSTSALRIDIIGRYNSVVSVWFNNHVCDV